jgi:PAS domain S-box-containing protein
MADSPEPDLPASAAAIRRTQPWHARLGSRAAFGPVIVVAVSVGLASIGSAWLWPVLQPFPAPLYLAAVMVSAWAGGLAPGLGATLLSTLAMEYLVMRSPLAEGSWSLHLIRILIFVLVASLITILNAARLRTQDAATRSEHFLQTTLDSLSVQVALIDGKGTIVAANDAWHRFLRTEQEPGARGAVGTNYLDVWRSDDGGEAAAIEDGMRDVLVRQRHEFFGEFPQWRAGERHWFAVRITRFQGSGRVCVVAVHEDLTERRRADEAERREEALRSVARLASAAAHEINNPLAIIMGNVEIIADQVSDDASARIRPTLDAVERIRVIVQRMTRITDLKLYERSPSLPEMLDLQGSSAALDPPRPE